MSLESRDSREMWWTVALEATLFFSLPGWAFSANRAWPANCPIVFTLAVLAGASLATALCHFAPALWARKHNLPWPVAFCLAAGAASSFAWTILINPRGLTSLILVLVMLAIAWNSRSCRIATLFCLVFGVTLLVVLFLRQSTGLWIHNPHLSSEENMGNNTSVFVGMLAAAAPAAILAMRIGRTAPSARHIWWSAAAGIWVPSVAAMTIASLAMMGGTRLHWVPSLLSGYSWAFVPISGITRFLPTVATIGTILVYATCIKEVTRTWSTKGQFAAAFLWAACLAGTIAHILTYRGPLRIAMPEYYVWSSGILIGCVLIGLWSLIERANSFSASSNK